MRSLPQSLIAASALASDDASGAADATTLQHQAALLHMSARRVVDGDHEVLHMSPAAEFVGRGDSVPATALAALNLRAELRRLFKADETGHLSEAV